jgi:hypothetical protein
MVSSGLATTEGGRTSPIQGRFPVPFAAVGPAPGASFSWMRCSPVVSTICIYGLGPDPVRSTVVINVECSRFEIYLSAGQFADVLG